jgi:acyl-CoA synthetase (AMP-forming)/AMP-acid ligase II
MHLSERLRSVLALDPSAPAIEFERRWHTWGELRAIVDGTDALLGRAGIGEHACVGVLLRNRPELVAGLVCVLASGRCLVSVNPLAGTARLSEELHDLRLPALLGHEEDWRNPSIVDAARSAGTLGIALAGEASPACHLVAGLETGVGPHRPPEPGVAIEMLTSGTTGRPKRVPLSYAALEQSLVSSEHYESTRSEAPSLKRGVALIYNSLVHIGGMWHAIKCVHDGRSICLLERFDVERWADAVERHGLSVAGLVPAAMRAVLEADVPKGRLRSLRAVLAGTAPLPVDMQTSFEERYGIPVLPTYGATEFAGAVAGWTLKLHREWAHAKRGSAGRAHPGCELRIVDPDSGTPLPSGASGLLEVRAPQLGRADWVRTTDRARLDADAFLWIEGRADGAINRGGFKVDPATVARALETHPAVREAAVVGLPDTRLGEVPVAAVELKEGAQRPSEDELRRIARDRLPPYFVPVRIHIVTELPRTPSLKVSQPALRELLARDLSAEQTPPESVHAAPTTRRAKSAPEGAQT